MDKQAATLAIKIARAFVDTGTFVVDKPHTAEAHIRGLATLLEKALAELPDGDSTEPHNLLLQMQQQLGTPIGEVRVETLDGKLYHYTNWPPEVEAARSKSQPAMGIGAEPVACVMRDPKDPDWTIAVLHTKGTELPVGTQLYTHPAPTAQDSKAEPENLVARVIYLVRGYQEALDEGNRGDASHWKTHLQRLLSAAPSLAENPQWVRCEERLPTDKDADFQNNIWVFDHVATVWNLTDLHNHLRAFPNAARALLWHQTSLQRPQPPEKK